MLETVGAVYIERLSNEIKEKNNKIINNEKAMYFRKN